MSDFTVNVIYLTLCQRDKMQYAGFNYLKTILCPSFSKFFTLLYMSDNHVFNYEELNSQLFVFKKRNNSSLRHCAKRIYLDSIYLSLAHMVNKQV